MNLTLQFEQANGTVRTDTVPVETSEQKLSELLDEQGVALNYRCGGQGLCKGCLVEDPECGYVRACQVQVGELKGPLRIPMNSQAISVLHGVTDFQVSTDCPLKVEPRAGVGMVLDIGTTTVAGSLWNLEQSSCLVAESIGNSQWRYGDNIVSRITYSLQHVDGLKQLNRSLLQDTLKPLVESLLKAAQLDRSAITECLVAANPTMLHMLSMDSLEGMAQFPFEIKYLSGRAIENPLKRLSGLEQMYLLPSMGPFVGSDITAGAIAAGMHERREGNELLIDFGTNGEILLRAREDYFATATAAGPAFEGGVV